MFEHRAGNWRSHRHDAGGEGDCGGFIGELAQEAFDGSSV